MQSKPKPKECKVCGRIYPPFKSTQQACSAKCAYQLVKIRKAKKERIDWKKDNDLRENKSKLQNSINRLARVIDFGLPCLAREYFPKQMHGGHIFSRGSASEMRYNLHNIHRQSAQSNHFQNEDGLLRKRLIEEYGQEYYEDLDALHQTPPLKYTAAEYYGFYLKCNKLVREYEACIKAPLSVKDRVRLRNEANLRLGIYEPNYCVINPK